MPKYTPPSSPSSPMSPSLTHRHTGHIHKRESNRLLLLSPSPLSSTTTVTTTTTTISSPLNIHISGSRRRKVNRRTIVNDSTDDVDDNNLPLRTTPGLTMLSSHVRSSSSTSGLMKSFFQKVLKSPSMNHSHGSGTHHGHRAGSAPKHYSTPNLPPVKHFGVETEAMITTNSYVDNTNDGASELHGSTPPQSNKTRRRALTRANITPIRIVDDTIQYSSPERFAKVLNQSQKLRSPPSSTTTTTSSSVGTRRKRSGVSKLARKLFASRKENIAPPGTPPSTRHVASATRTTGATPATSLDRVISPEPRSETLRLDLCSPERNNNNDQTCMTGCSAFDSDIEEVTNDEDEASVEHEGEESAVSVDSLGSSCVSTAIAVGLKKRNSRDSIFYL